MTTLRRDTAEYILSLHNKISSSTDRPLDISYYNQLAKQLEDLLPSQTFNGNLLELTIQTLSQFGISKGLSILASKKFNRDDVLNDTRNKKFITKTEVQEKMKSPVISYENAMAGFNKFYFNFLNKWHISFGNNVVLNREKNTMDINTLLSLYASEVSLPSIDISTTSMNLDYTRNEDVSGVDYNEISVSFILDKNKLIHKSFLKIINEIKNFKTGRYGYRSDYQFETIEIAVFDNWNNSVDVYTMNNCVLKNISDLSLTDASAEMKTLTVTFSYDFFTSDSVEI